MVFEECNPGTIWNCGLGRQNLGKELGSPLEVGCRGSKAIKRTIEFYHRNLFRNRIIPVGDTVFDEKIDGHLVHGGINDFEKDVNALDSVCAGSVGTQTREQ